jgi:hypothetical protein
MKRFVTSRVRHSRVGVAMIVLLTLILAGLVLPISALANHCDGGDFCVWGSPGFTGDHIADPDSDASWPCGTFCSPDVDENDDALRNRNATKVRVYSLDNFSGALMYCVPAGVSEDDIADSRDNDGSSHRVFSGASCPSGEPRP